MAFSDQAVKHQQSTRQLDARGLVADAALSISNREMHAALAADPARWLVVQRSYDETPMKFMLGALAEELAPHARYIVPAHLRPVVGSPLMDWNALLQFGVTPGQKAIVDIFAFAMDIVSGDVRLAAESPCRVLKGKKAGHVHRAVTSAFDGKWDELLEAFPDKELVLLVDVSDSASSNRKQQSYQQFLLESRPGALCAPVRCSVHQLFRSLVVVIKRYEVMKGMFCLSNVVSVGSRQEAFKRALVSVVQYSFKYLDRNSDEPFPPATAPHRKHARVALNKLLWRRKVDSAK
eukprot:5713406-Pyramimonas_sp.AAC.1